jgi:hypothetical protein
MFYAIALLTSIASADVVMEPPECPTGAYGKSSHAGAWCAPDSCESNDDCETGEACQEYSMCIEESEIPCGGMDIDTAEECTITKTEVFGPCNPGDSCDQGTCMTELVCINPDELESDGDSGEPKEDSCGGCSTGTGSLVGVSVLLVAGILLGRRRE